ncbi:hypothetical protein ADL22_30470 [Streptomyces sp. NRRL F-4489]|uniref:hypothetical protein n=1 Tax=Streptomyces sp. NRRL F-4489 TaxID=1609095 RepID=UPI00074B0EA0|nr:hypothetical protein [Streptomyces sp. NRRL F-4489]KUL34375.1 hypothetical protein ADL22_30470 [Streptomyces sp. NRRL F-4489]
MVTPLRARRRVRAALRPAALAIATGIFGVALGGMVSASAEHPQPQPPPQPRLADVSNITLESSTGTWQTTASCRNGKTAIAGGVDVGVDQGATVEASRPTGTYRHGWYVRASTGKARITAYAICANTS